MTTLTNPEDGRFGTAVFVTQDGLTAEGDGLLSYASDNVPIFELRDGSTQMLHLAPEGTMTIFVSPVLVNNEIMLILGLAERARDAMGRSGVIGLGVLISQKDEDASRHVQHLRKASDAWTAFVDTEFRSKRHSGDIGYLTRSKDAPHRLTRSYSGIDFPAFTLAEGDDWKTGVNLAVQLALHRYDSASAVMIWPFQSDDHAPLTARLVTQTATEEKQRRDELRARQEEMRREQERQRRLEEQRLSQRSDFANDLMGQPARSYEAQHFADQAARYSAPSEPVRQNSRAEQFQRRSPLVEPRPSWVDVTTEDYLIRLIRLVLDETGATPPRSGPDRFGSNPSEPGSGGFGAAQSGRSDFKTSLDSTLGKLTKGLRGSNLSVLQVLTLGGLGLGCLVFVFFLTVSLNGSDGRFLGNVTSSQDQFVPGTLKEAPTDANPIVYAAEINPTKPHFH